MSVPALEPIARLPLKHNGDCSLLGVSPDLTIFVEEIYGEDGWLAQGALRLDGTWLASVDEDGGANADIAPLALPDDLHKPQPGWQTMRLNFGGARHRGMQEAERIADLVRPLTMREKMTLVERCRLNVAPPMLLGVAESYVLAEATLVRPNLFVVCRRVRLAYRLGRTLRDADHQPYDYDTRVIYLAHLYDRMNDAEPGLAGDDSALPGAALRRPMDCLICRNHLFVADGGDDDQACAVHVWRVDAPQSSLSDEELFLKRLYG